MSTHGESNQHPHELPEQAGREQAERHIDAGTMVASVDHALAAYADHIQPGQPDKSGGQTPARLTLWADRHTSATITLPYSAPGEAWPRVKMAGPKSIKTDPRHRESLVLVRGNDQTPPFHFVDEYDGMDSRVATAEELQYVDNVLQNGTPERPRMTLASTRRLMGRIAMAPLRRAGNAVKNYWNATAGELIPDRQTPPPVEQASTPKQERLRFWPGAAAALRKDLARIARHGFERNK